MVASGGGIDQLAGKMPGWSPYSYGFDNPMLFMDPDGKEPIGDYYNRQGKFVGSDGIDDQRIYLLNEGVNPNRLGLNSGPAFGLLYAGIRALNTTEVGGLMILNRTSEGSDYTIGELTLIGKNGTDNMFILEPGGPETTTPNLDKRIPDGVYDVDPYSSAKHPDNYILSNDDVSKNRAILIHSGNNAEHTVGCTLPGCSTGNESVQNSKQAMKDIRNFFRTNNNSVVNKGDDIKMIINTQINDQ